MNEAHLKISQPDFQELKPTITEHEWGSGPDGSQIDEAVAWVLEELKKQYPRFGDDDSNEELYQAGMVAREYIINALFHGNLEVGSGGDIAERGKENVGKNPDLVKRKILVKLIMSLDKFMLQISDQGKGYELNEVADPLAEENMFKTSGRGQLFARGFGYKQKNIKKPEWFTVELEKELGK